MPSGGICPTYATTHICQVGMCRAYANTHICQVGICQALVGICLSYANICQCMDLTHICQVGICQTYATTHICHVGICQAYAWKSFYRCGNALLFDALCDHAVLRVGSTALYLHAHWGMYCTQTNELQLHSFDMPPGCPITWLVAYARHIGKIGTL